MFMKHTAPAPTLGAMHPLRPKKLKLPIALPLILFLLPITTVQSHGFLSTPRSRNLVAYEDRVYYPITSDDPLPEDCPNCLNRGGTLGRCGVLHAGEPNERNYDLPKNAVGGAMRSNPQQRYSEGQVIEVEVQLTAHHKGHFEFKSCAIQDTEESPSQECFDGNPLRFVSDELYGATLDEDHPERAYVAPETVANKMSSEKNNFEGAMVFKYKLKLPDGLVGDLVLIQWYYVASNSACIHPGYDTYDWPVSWLSSAKDGDSDGAASVWDLKAMVGTGLKMCDEVLPEDGNGLPEQFWNCAEVTITEAAQEDQAPLISQKSRGHGKTIIGYYASWQWYDRQKLAKPSNMDFTKVTRVNFAFFQTDVEGNLWGTDSWADPNLLFGPFNWNPTPEDPEYCSWDTPHAKTCKTHHYEEGLIHQVHAAGAEIWPSLGGWSLSDPFPEMAADDGARMHFAEKCVELIEDYDFDGLDIDWEYPGYEDHSGTPADTESYNLLLRDLRMKLDELGQRTGKFYGLTAALPCGTNNIANIDIPTVANYLTEFNLMTYDFFGSWSPTTGTNAPLYDQEWGDDDVNGFSVDGCTRNWINGGASPSAINIGLPFYGRSFIKAKGLNEPHEGNDKNTWFWDDGSPQYFNIVEKLPDLVSVRHEQTKTQYAYKDSTTGGLVSYDDEEAICDKTEYCLDYNLNGFIIWELSGDLMPDLSTPLLDTLNNKLIDPSLDCKSLEYDPDSVSEDPTFSAVPDAGIQQYPNPNQSQNEPLPAPSTMVPTEPLYCPEGATGQRQYGGCIGYYYCLYGTAKYPFIPCPQGTMFDENSMLCLPKDSVTCSETQSPTSFLSTRIPTYYPTNFPTVAPVALPPVVTTYVLLGGDRPTRPLPSTQTSISSTQSKLAPTNAASFPSNPSSVESIAVMEESIDISPSAISCPYDYTGILPWNDCTEYFYCIYAVPHLPTVSCEAGKKFDMDAKVCLDAAQVSCPSSDTSLETNDTADKPATRPKPPRTAGPSEQRTRTPTMPPTDPPSLSKTEPPTTKEPTVGPTHRPTQPKSTQSVLDSLLSQSYIESNGNNSPQQSPILDNKPASTQSAQPLVENNNNNSLQSSTSSESITAGIPGSTIEIHHKVNVVSYFWSSGGYSSSSSTEFGGAPNNLPLPQDFALNRPFITIELSFNGFPGDIGWQLMSVDGAVNVAKPPGAYSGVEPYTTVHEGISLQTGLDPSDGILELKWTIINSKGNGLAGGGNYKIFADFPLEANLLAMGDNFEYMESIGLAVTNKGLITILQDGSSEETASNSTHSLQNQETGNDAAGKMAASNSTHSLQNQETGNDAAGKMAAAPQINPDHKSQTAGSTDSNWNHYNMQSDEKASSILIPALISLVAIALVAGLVFLVFAYRRKPPPAPYFDEETNFDEGSWNVEGGAVTPEEEFYESYYNTDDEQDINCLYITDSVSSIDPPDSLSDGNESEPDVADFTASEPPHGEAFNDYFNTVEEEHDDQDPDPLRRSDADEHTAGFSDATNPRSLAGENQPIGSNNVEELLEATRADLEQNFVTDIYSILDKLEEEEGGGQTVYTDSSRASSSRLV